MNDEIQNENMPENPENNTATWWFQDGLRFSCAGCGGCCTGAPGYVWVNDEEIDALAHHFGLDFAEFETIYVRKIGKKKSLREFQNYDCVFFDRFQRNCKVYRLRPRQCGTWPFWDSNIETEEDWEQIARKCPGCNQGELIPVDEILRRKAVIRI